MTAKDAAPERKDKTLSLSARRAINRVLREAYGLHARDRITRLAVQKMLGRSGLLTF